MKVLVALDFGDSSLEALRQARALAHDVGGTLSVCHVLPATEDPTAALLERDLTDDGVDTSEDAMRTRRELVEHARSRLGLELTEVFIERGAADAAIVRCAARCHANFIVIGSHSRTGLAHMLLGSVAERVVRHAGCSVLVARPAPSSGVVLSATDLSEPSLPALAAAAAAAKRSGARLVAVSVLEWPSSTAASLVGLLGTLPAMPPVELQQQTREAARSTLERAMEQVGAVGEARILEGSPASQIVACAEELRPELVVVGAHGRSGLSRLALGSVAESVIRSVASSVLAVRDRA